MVLSELSSVYDVPSVFSRNLETAGDHSRKQKRVSSLRMTLIKAYCGILANNPEEDVVPVLCVESTRYKQLAQHKICAQKRYCKR